MTEENQTKATITRVVPPNMPEHAYWTFSVYTGEENIEEFHIDDTENRNDAIQTAFEQVVSQHHAIHELRETLNDSDNESAVKVLDEALEIRERIMQAIGNDLDPTIESAVSYN